MEARISEAVARALLRAIARLAERPEECARSPGLNFTRNRKLGPARLLLLLVTWGQDTAASELANLAGWDGSAPSGAALTQQWGKLNDLAMPRLLRSFLGMFEPAAYLGRYRLYAADGTELQLLRGTGGDRCRVRNGNGDGSHWEAHLTCAFDLVRLRVVRLRLPAADGDGARGDRWLNLVTDLPADGFPPGGARRALRDALGRGDQAIYPTPGATHPFSRGRADGPSTCARSSTHGS